MLAFSLQKKRGDAPAADAALLRAAAAAEARPLGDYPPSGPTAPFRGPAGGAPPVLAAAPGEIAGGETDPARRHLQLVLDRYAAKSPTAAQQARGDLAWLNGASVEPASRPAQGVRPAAQPVHAGRNAARLGTPKRRSAQGNAVAAR